jgi:NAD(P)-dependent dehydrogenase (short-subunit alcohol dehydrogenase family)
MSQTVLITGSSSGIGKAAALYFAKQGWQVAATMRTPAQETELTQFPNIKLYALDVTDTASIDTAISQILSDFGALDVVVNNAGFGADGVFEAMDDAFIQRQFDTNVFGLMRVTRAVLPHMRSRRQGTIVQIASMGGRITFPLYSIYHGTKWAVEGFSEALQYELKGFGIRVKIVEPGAIKTEFYGRSRAFAKPTTTTDYDTLVAQCEAVTSNAANNGASPEQVAATIFKAATDKGSRMRYLVGSPAPLLVRLRKLIPDRWWFGIVHNTYKI